MAISYIIMVKQVNSQSVPVGSKMFGRFALKGKTFPCVVISHSHKKKSKKWTIEFKENFAKNYGPPPRKYQTEGIQTWKLFFTKEEADKGWEPRETKCKINKKIPVGKSFADYKKDMVEKFPPAVIGNKMDNVNRQSFINCYVYIKSLNLPDDFNLDEQIKVWDEEAENARKEAQAKKEKEIAEKKALEKFQKEQMEKLWEANKEKLMLQFQNKPVQEVMEKIEEEEVCDNEDVAEVVEKLNVFYKIKGKKKLLEWVKENTENFEDVKKMKAGEIKQYIKNLYEE